MPRPHAGHCPHSSGNFSMAVVLDEVVDEDYEPSPQEITEYAEWLGMDPAQDQDLYWIARDGLKAPLPAAWKPCQSGDGNVFYFNFETGESVWEHPCDEHYRRVYRRAKMRRDAPVRLVTISGACKPEDLSLLNVMCTGSLNGEVIAVMTVKPDMKVRVFRSLLAKQLDASKRRLRIMLEDARLVTEDEDRTAMNCLLSVTCQADEEPSATSKEEQKRQRRELKERRMREYLDRCQLLLDGGHGHIAAAPSGEVAQQKSTACGENLAAMGDTLAAVALAEVEAQTSPSSVMDKTGSCAELSPENSTAPCSPSDQTAMSAQISGGHSDDPALTSSGSSDHTNSRPREEDLRATEDPGDPELKSFFTQGSGADVISRQRPQSLRLRPISSCSRHSADGKVPDTDTVCELESSAAASSLPAVQGPAVRRSSV